MEDKHSFQAMDKVTFEHVLQHYTSSLSPEVSEDLNDLRYRTIPDAVEARCDDAYLDKEQLVDLVIWKLKHGTFRPTLKALVQQNDAKVIEQTSREGFAEFRNGDCKAAMKRLTSLRGIGPATASLMLSVYDPVKAPFFSDELFRWVFFQPGGGKGWDRPIKYTAKEYAELYEKVRELLVRLDVSAVDAEKVAFVLGKGGSLGLPAQERAAKDSKQEPEEKAIVERKDKPSESKKQKRAQSNRAPSGHDNTSSLDEAANGSTSEVTSVRRSKRQKTE